MGHHSFDIHKKSPRRRASLISTCDGGLEPLRYLNTIDGRLINEAREVIEINGPFQLRHTEGVTNIGSNFQIIVMHIANPKANFG
jgi:hypothetical protein